MRRTCRMERRRPWRMSAGAREHAADTHCTIRGEMYGAGVRKWKKVFTADPKTAKVIPRSHARSVSASRQVSEASPLLEMLTWHFRIVDVGHGRADLGVRTVLLAGVYVEADDAPSLARLLQIPSHATPRRLAIWDRHVPAQLGHAITSPAQTTTCARVAGHIARPRPRYQWRRRAHSTTLLWSRRRGVGDE